MLAEEGITSFHSACLPLLPHVERPPLRRRHLVILDVREDMVQNGDCLCDRGSLVEHDTFGPLSHRGICHLCA
jgi:hypothetical protein